MNEPKVLTRMRLSCCWGDNLNEKELNEVVDYISYLQNNWNKLKQWLEHHWQENQDIWFVKIIGKMQELENDNNENNK